MSTRVLATATLIWLCLPSGVWVGAKEVRPGATGEKIPSVFLDAGPQIKLFLILMVLAAILAVALAVKGQIGRSARPPMGTRFVSSLRLGGVLLGLSVGLYHFANMLVRVSYDGGMPPFHIFSAGLAEVAVILLAGLIASTAAVFAHVHMTPRPE